MTSINKKIFFNFSYFLIALSTFLQLTVLANDIPDKVFLLMKLVAILSLIVKIFLDFDETIILSGSIIAVSIVLLINLYYVKNYSFILVWLLMLGSKNVDMKKLIKYNLIATSIVLIVVMILSKINVISNFIYFRDVNGTQVTRESLGTIYPTVLGSIIFFLLLQYVYCRKGWYRVDSVIFLLCGIFVDKLTDNRLVTILCTLMGIIAFFRLDRLFLKHYRLTKIVSYISIFLPVGFTMACYYYKWDSTIYSIANQILSGRIYLSWLGFQKYSLKIFAQIIQMNGSGNNREFAYGESYFYLDSLPIYLIINFGIIIFLLYFVYNYGFLKFCQKNNDISLFLILILIIIYDIVDDKSIYVGLNPFVLLLFNKYIYRNVGAKYENNQELSI